MTDARFKAENGLLVTGANSIFEKQVTINANCTVNADLFYLGGNLHVVGNQIISGNTIYAVDLLPDTNGLKLGNTTNGWDVYARQLTVAGNSAFSANVSVTGQVTISNTVFANVISSNVAANTSTLRAISGNNTLSVIPFASNTAINQIVVDGDTFISSVGAVSNTGNLSIGTWTTRVGGFGIRFTTSNYNIEVKANTISFGAAAISANGTVGTAGQVLTSNGTAAYWSNTSASGVTAVYSGNGISGGTITSNGTLIAVGANGISVTSTGINVVAGNNQLIANTSGIFVDQTKIAHNSLSGYNANSHIDHSTISIEAGVGLSGGGTLVSNRSLSVNAAYIATISSNNATYLNGIASTEYQYANTAINTTNISSQSVSYANTAGALITTNDYRVSSLGVGTVASGVAGSIRATNEVTAYYSDRRLKNIEGPIGSALDKVKTLSGVYFNANEVAAEYGYDTTKRQVGVIAQEVEAVLPEVISPAPFDIEVITYPDGSTSEISLSGQNYKTVNYEKLVPLLIEAIKELSAKVDNL